MIVEVGYHAVSASGAVPEVTEVTGYHAVSASVAVPEVNEE